MSTLQPQTQQKANESQPNLTPKEKEEALERTAVIKLKMVAQMLNCIEVASSRGAFRANELTYVGSLYDVLSKGLQNNFVQYLEDKNKTNINTEEGVENKESVQSELEEEVNAEEVKSSVKKQRNRKNKK